MAVDTHSSLTNKPVTKGVITQTMFGLMAGLVVVSFVFPIRRVTKLYEPAGLYFIEGMPRWEFLGSVILSLIAALAVVLAVCLAAARAGISKRTIERALAAALIFCTAVIATPYLGGSPIAGWGAGIIAAAIVVSGTRLGEVIRTVLSRLSLIGALACMSVLGYEVATAAFSSPQPIASQFLKTEADARAIVVLLFDELDEELAFRLRPEGIALPNIAKFDSEALHATHVSPIADMTTKAIPSILTGRVVERAEPRSRERLDVYGAGETNATALDAGDTIFAKLKGWGLNSAVLGWHHPYCSLFASEISACETHPNLDATDSSRLAFYYGQKGLTLFAPFTIPANRGIREQYHAVAQEQNRQRKEGLRTLTSWIADRRLDFIWAHVPYPHPPGMVSVSGRAGEANYFDNLALVDETVGTVVAELKRNGRWADSIVVVTSDHGLRRGIWQDRPVWTGEEDRLVKKREHQSVPLIVHLPRQSEHVPFAKPINALLLHDAILEWSQGRLTEPEALTAWLTSRSQ